MSVHRMARVANRAVTLVSGSESAHFLNGVLASAIRPNPREPFFSAMLNAQGKVLYDLLVYPHSLPDGKNAYLIEHDSRPTNTPFLSALKRFILRSKVKTRDVSDEFDVFALWSSPSSNVCPRKTWKRAPSGVAEPNWPEDEWPWSSPPAVGVPSLLDMRAPGMGSRFLVRKGDLPPNTSDADEVTFSHYLEHRISRGVPEGFIDIPPDQAFPMEANLDLMGGLDFRKGCYVGQELTVRTYHTGMIRKRILPVRIETLGHDGSLDAGTVIRPHALPGSNISRPRGSGKLLSNVNGLGLALLRLEQVHQALQGKLRFLVSTPTSGEHQISPLLPDWWPSNQSPEEA